MSVKTVKRRVKHKTGVDELRSIYQATLPAMFGYLMMHTGGSRELAMTMMATTKTATAKRTPTPQVKSEALTMSRARSRILDL